MKTTIALTILFAASLFAVTPAGARVERSASAKHEFQHMTPCPSTGQNLGKCPGYVIDHIDPLCHGGADAPANMQWQTIADGKAKDQRERELCHVSYRRVPSSSACLTGPRGGRYRMVNGHKRYGC
ncbi:hypothetical protein SAMN04515620_10530 [Collimonas sp. OK607]|uniref:HNH endonuclease signature motif containing protein n=1 Tax=Collimonas sp. OK607 TaxID=1798194 RepID=UPI0008F03556|nr:HNH endonuclease signature motif containing protein [Collimonas sp. OK607]SFA84822.1 hypothetical protein SAMN04515620_10530 [Collimonas sp. OK607]